MSLLAAWITLMSTLFGAADDPECYLLGSLDVARAEALADSNLSELRAVYASETAASPDERLLKRYAARGYRVVGAGIVRDACRVVERSPQRLDLEVVDRMSGAWVVSETGRAVRLPRDQATRHRIVLTGGTGNWRISSIG